MLVKWNKEFYEKYKDVFPISVLGKVTFTSTVGTWETTRITNTTLDMSGYNVNGDTLEVPNDAYSGKYPTTNVYMEVPDELVDIFPELESVISCDISYSTSSYGNWF